MNGPFDKVNEGGVLIFLHTFHLKISRSNRTSDFLVIMPCMKIKPHVSLIHVHQCSIDSSLRALILYIHKKTLKRSVLFKRKYVQGTTISTSMRSTIELVVNQEWTSLIKSQCPEN